MIAGTKVKFKWLGGTHRGTISELNKRLTELENEPVYWCLEQIDNKRYPINLKDITVL